MKKAQHQDPFANQVLDAEEQSLEEALERGEYEETTGSDFETTRLMFQDAAKRFKQLNTSKPITIRVNQLDLVKLKAKAKQKQIPYQTLLGALIHSFAKGETELSLK